MNIGDNITFDDVYGETRNAKIVGLFSDSMKMLNMRMIICIGVRKLNLTVLLKKRIWNLFTLK